MTTVIATRKAIYADTMCSYTVPFKVSKITRIGKSIYAGAGDLDDLQKFFDWRQGGDEPTIEESFDVLEIAPDGLFLWGKKLVRLELQDKFYAVGSGAQYAMGAMAMGATPEKAIEVAARFDPSTRLPLEVEQLKK